MKTAWLHSGSSCGVFLLTSLLIATTVSSRGDQVDMQNGDHYSGKVVAMDANTIVLNSEVLGTVRVRRAEVVSINLGTGAGSAESTSATSKAPRVATLTPVRPTQPPATVPARPSLQQQIAANPNLINQVQSEILAGAGPKATKKFDELITGLSTGNVTVAAIRKEAESVAAQLRQLRNSGDDESGGIFDEYLAVLDSFLQETKGTTAPANSAPVKRQTINPAAPSPASKPAASLLDDE